MNNSVRELYLCHCGFGISSRLNSQKKCNFKLHFFFFLCIEVFILIGCLEAKKV
jgi:hypothetical protein